MLLNRGRNALGTSSGGSGGSPTPPTGMAFLYAENGTPVLDKNNEQVYAKDSAP